MKETYLDEQINELLNEDSSRIKNKIVEKLKTEAGIPQNFWSGRVGNTHTGAKEVDREFEDGRNFQGEFSGQPDLEEAGGYSGKEFTFILLNKGSKKVLVKGTTDSEDAYLKIVKKYGKGTDPMLYSIDGNVLKGFGGIEPRANKDFKGKASVIESSMGEIDIIAQESKDLKEFIKEVFKEFKDLEKTKESVAWLKSVYDDRTNESVNESKDAKFKVEIDKLNTMTYVVRVYSKFSNGPTSATFFNKTGADMAKGRVEFLNKYNKIKSVSDISKSLNESVNEGVWTSAQEKAVATLDKKFSSLLTKKGIDAYSHEASKLWKSAGFQKIQRKIFGKDESVNEGMFDFLKKKKSGDGEEAWYYDIADGALEYLQKKYKALKPYKLSALGPGNNKDYIDFGISNSKNPRTADLYWKGYFDKNNKIVKVIQVGNDFNESVNELASFTIDDLVPDVIPKGQSDNVELKSDLRKALNIIFKKHKINLSIKESVNEDAINRLNSVKDARDKMASFIVNKMANGNKSDKWYDNAERVQLKKSYDNLKKSYLKAGGKEIKVESVNEEVLNENWFDIITQGALVVTAVLMILQSAGIKSTGDAKKVFQNLKKTWKNRNVDPELKKVILKMTADKEIVKAAKEKVLGRMSRHNKYLATAEANQEFREFLKKRLSTSDWAIISKYSKMGIFSKDPSAGFYTDKRGFNRAADRFGESINELKEFPSKEKIVDYMVKHGNNKNDAKKLVDKQYEYVKQTYKNSGLPKIADVIATID